MTEKSTPPDGVDPSRAGTPNITAIRTRQAHADRLACAPTLEAIAAAELAVGAGVDGRVTAAAMERAMDRARRAAALKPVEQAVLSGFTRVVDAKLSLTPSLLAALAAEVDAPDQLIAAIDAGPGDGAVVWTRPRTRVEFVASLIRQLVLGGGASMQLQVNAEQASFLERVVESEGGELRRAMGGAGAFASNLLSAFSSVTPRFFSKEPLPRAIADRFSARVEVVDGAGVVKAARDSADDLPARVNFSCEYSAGQHFSVLGRPNIAINGVVQPLVIGGSGRVILGTIAKDIVPGFGELDADVVDSLAADNDIAFLVGSHHLTQGTPELAHQRAQALAQTLRAMKQKNPSLVRHHQYVLPKIADNEAIVMGATKGAWDSLSMNAVEVPALLTRLRAGGLTTLGGGITEHQGRDASEEPAAMIDGALAVADGVGVRRVHLHGLLGDLVIIRADVGDDASGASPDDGNVDVERAGVDVDRVRLALMKARQLASVKAANTSGEIKSADDLFDVDPVVQGVCLAAVERFADAVAARYGLSPAARDQVARDWHFSAPAGDGTGALDIFFVPSRGIHDRTGGTVSLGDTIDISALVFSAQKQRPRLSPTLKARTAFSP